MITTSTVEKKRHGTPDFPIEYYYLEENTPRYVMPAHWHTDIEIIRVKKGSFKAYLNNSEYIGTPENILFVEGGCLHRGQPRDCVYECVVFDPAMLLHGRVDAAEKYILPFVDVTANMDKQIFRKDSEVPSVVDKLFESLRERKDGYELEVMSILYEIVRLLWLEGHVSVSKRGDTSPAADTVRGIIGHLERNFKEQVKLDELAKIAGVSKIYLCRIFKEYTSKTVVEYLNELRISAACHDMTVRGKSITEAAYDSGFNDLSYFSKIFRRYMGETPKNYKERMCR